jgi:4-amino-4-deoxy-L-arabinose transferase-like glycosyltransferase
MAPPARPLQLELSSGTENKPKKVDPPVQGKCRYIPAIVLGLLLAGFLIIESFIPLGTAVQIGADEGFELAKATLCLKGHRLYTEVWNDQPPLHTFLVTQILKHLSRSALGPRVLTIAFSLLLLSAIFIIALRVHGVAVACLATAFVIVSPGFIELSSSCMLEIPALAMAVTAVCLLIIWPPRRSLLSEVVAGAVFGLGLQMKLVPVIYLPLIALLIYLRYQRAANPLKRMFASLLVLGGSLAVAFVTADLLIEQGTYLIHFQQSWSSHFGSAKSFEYGSASEHPFQWIVLAKNWDTTIPALTGLALLIPLAKIPAPCTLPLTWTALSFLVFGIHRPWWQYYYLHTAIPLCWCAGYASVFVFRRVKLLNRWSLFTATCLFALCAAAWMGARVYFQVTSLRQSPQTYSSPVIAQMQRFKPFTQWLYADQLALSFHAGIPIVPSLAVVPLKRMWSGDLTSERIAEEVDKHRPGLIQLLNDTRELPFQHLLRSEYQLVYMDDDNRLYALKAIAKKP